jgi:peptidoglycan/xylan/chitin deacetylase (PgdA/CDA1 family)
LHLLKYAGVFHVWRHRHRNDVVILMLHGTANPKHPSMWKPLRPQFSPRYIDWCMRIIGRHYRFISMDDAVGILKGEKPPVECGIVMTMDDGYKSNVSEAWPVFRKYDAHMTVFLPVTNIENRMPMWFDRLDYILQMSEGDNKIFDIGNVKFRFSWNRREDLAASYACFREVIKKEYANEEAFHAKLDEIITHYERSGGKSLGTIFEEDPWSGLLNWEEINRCQGEGVRFGSHTMDHYRVDRLNGDALRYQLEESKRVIEEKTGTPCDYIAYPNGDCSESARNVALESGYLAGVTTDEGINKIGCDTMMLKRISLPWTSDETELLAYVSGLSNGLSYRRWVDH